MKALLGAAAAVSGVGTLVYLLARSGRRRDTGQPTTPSGTPHVPQAPQKHTSDTVVEKDGSYEQQNGHLPCTATTKDVMLGSAVPPHTGVTLKNDACDVSAGVGEISSDAPQLQNKTPGVDDVEVKTQQVRVKAEVVTQKTSDGVNLQSHSEQDDSVMTQEKHIETTHKISDDAVMPSKDSESQAELTNNPAIDDIISRETNNSTLLEATCVSEPIQKPIEIPDTEAIIVSEMSNDLETEHSLPPAEPIIVQQTSNDLETEHSLPPAEPIIVQQTSNDLETEHSLPPAEPITVPQTSTDLETEHKLPPAEPVVEELSQCLILKPQCDPTCCEHLIDTCHNTCPKESTSETTGTSLNETEVTLGGELSERTLESNPEEQHYTLVLKSDDEEVCISGKHLPDPSPAELPADLPADLPAELNEEEKMTPSLATEQKHEDCTVNETVLIHSDRNDSCSEAVTGGDNDNTVKSTPQEPDSEVECPVKIEVTLCPDEELSDSEEEGDNTQELKEDKEEEVIEDKPREKEEERDNKEEEITQEEKLSEKEEEYGNKQEKLNEKKEEESENKPEIIQNKEQDDVTVKQECDASNIEVTEQQEKSNSEDDVTIKQKQEESNNCKQEITKQEKQSNNEEEATKKQEEESNSKQEKNEKQEKDRIEEKEGSKEEKKIKEEENKEECKIEEKEGDKEENRIEEKEGNKEENIIEEKERNKEENIIEEKEGNKEEYKIEEKEGSKEENRIEEKEGNKEENIIKDKGNNEENKIKEEGNNEENKIKEEENTNQSDKQEITKQQQQQTGDKHDIKTINESTVEIVTEEQIVNSPLKSESVKKGSVRSRGDSASADLDCDLGSEQDNLNCDASSLKSMDSGQGSSEIEPETLFGPSTFPVTNQEQYIFYDFEIPQMLVGRLIGRKGAFINKIKATTDATVIVHPHKNRKLKLCSVEGTKLQVNAALEMIRKHFPETQYPDITLVQVSSHQQQTHAASQVQPTLNAQSMQIELTAGVVVEVRVSSVVSGGEMWVQQPLHPSYSALHRLHTCMNLNYGDGSNTPPLPGPISDGTVCVARVRDCWMRCQVLNSANSHTNSCVLLLDTGGFLSVPSSSLRQIRYDYMTLPFQASQCFLHGVQPISGDTWNENAATLMDELVSGVILFAVVVSYTQDSVPIVNLYRRDEDKYVLLNEKLVEFGYGQWSPPQPSS